MAKTNDEVLIKNTAIATDSAGNPTEAQAVLPFAPTEEVEVEKLSKLPKKLFYRFCKRCFDFITCLLALIFLSPTFLVIAIIIKCTSKGPVLYKQERLGLNGKKFTVVKFRSMHVNAEKNGAQWSGGENDKRIYPFGRKLRRSRLDELPQLWLCVTGKMSLVGPRPEREVFYKEFEKYVHGFSQRLLVKPGLTGLAQVNGGYNLKPEEKIVHDIEYIKKRSLLLDAKILFKTIAIVFNHKGAK